MLQPHFLRLILPLWFWVLAASLSTPALARDILVSRYDFYGTGANLSETTLNTGNVNATRFGRLFSLPIEGNVYAQPLYVENLPFPGSGARNTLYVATMDDRVYAFDGDDGNLIWRQNLVPANAKPFPIVDVATPPGKPGTNSLNIAGNVGIEGTPVIDKGRNAIYLVTRTKESGQSVFRLHALDLNTGAEKFNGPVLIAGTNGGVNFDPNIHNQRAGLTIAQGKVLVTFGSHEDFFGYYGWIMAYDTGTLQATGVLNTAPTGGRAAIWMSGRAPVVDDAGKVYLTLGNGLGPRGYDGVSNFGESVIKLDLSNGIQVVDSFTPEDWAAMDTADRDFGSSGPVLVPELSRIIAGGKDSRLFVLDANNLGHLSAGNTGAIQTNTSQGSFWSGPAVWKRPTQGWLLYHAPHGTGNNLKSYPLDASGIDTAKRVMATTPTYAFPGGNLIVSANGEKDGSGIVWSYGTSLSSIHQITPGELRAHDAVTLTKLWSSLDDPPRDDSGLYAKFVAPVVTGGKVYQATSSNQIVVYGLLPTGPDFTVTALPARSLALGGQAHFDLNAADLNGFSGNVAWSVDGLPAGASAAISQASPLRAGVDVSLPPGTPAGPYRLTLTGSSGAISHSQPVILEVTGTEAVSRIPSAWSVLSFDSQETVGQPGFASNAIDEDPNTIWHTQWSGTAVPALPHELVIDLGSVQTLSGLSYLPRQSGGNNGTVRQYEIAASNDGINWGAEIAGGSFDYSNHDPNAATSALRRRQQVTLDGTTARFVRFRARSEVNGGPWTSAAEIDLFTATGANPTADPSPAAITPLALPAAGPSPAPGAAAYTLSVNKTGSGSGTVRSSRPGIRCGSHCSKSFPSGRRLTLVAKPAANSVFTGWSGACSGLGSCRIDMGQDQQLTANFAIKTFTLTVQSTGPGSVDSTSDPGIACGAECTETYAFGTQVILSARADDGARFKRWARDCRGAGPKPSCTLVMRKNRQVRASFR